MISLIEFMIDFLIDESIYLLPITLLALIFVAREKPLRIVLLLLGALVATFVGLALSMGVYLALGGGYFVAAELIIGFLLLSPFWTVLVRKGYKIKGRVFPLVVLLPVFYLGVYQTSYDFYRKITQPGRDALYWAADIRMSMEIFYVAIKDYQDSCGKIPEVFEKLIQPDPNCPQWLGYKQLDYREGDALRDPWGRWYLYKVIDANTFEIGTLGADGVVGGEGINRDVFHTMSTSNDWVVSPLSETWARQSPREYGAAVYRSILSSDHQKRIDQLFESARDRGKLLADKKAKNSAEYFAIGVECYRSAVAGHPCELKAKDEEFYHLLEYMASGVQMLVYVPARN